MFAEQIELLQNMPLFGGMTKETLELIVDASDIIPIKKGEYAFRENDTGNTMFVVVQGNMAVLKKHNDKIYKLAEYGLGECFGVMEALNPSRRFYSVYALEESAAIKISSSDMLSLYHANLEQYTLMQMNMGREICRRMRRVEEKLFNKCKISNDLIEFID